MHLKPSFINSDHKIKSYSRSNFSTKMGIKEKGGKSFLGNKMGNKGITNRSKKIANRGRDFKSRQRDSKSGRRLQIQARGISNWGRNYKTVQNNIHVEIAEILVK